MLICFVLLCIYIHFDVSFLGLKNRGIKDSKCKLCEPELVHVVNLGGHSEAPVHLRHLFQSNSTL